MFEGGTDNLLNSGSNLDVSQDDIYNFSDVLSSGETMAQVKQQAEDSKNPKQLSEE